MNKISVITVCFNSAETIKDTITSVASQDYDNYEHLIVDGGSVDGTVKIVSSADSITNFISEPDKGIYDAMNKGIQMATGDVIGFLNADDVFADSKVLSGIALAFDDSAIEACYTDLVYVSQNDVNNIVRYWKSGIFKPGLFKCGWMPPHPTFYARREVYAKYGVFNLDYKIAADVELLFRFLEKYLVRTKYLPFTSVKMRLGGTTNKNIRNIVAQNKEILRMLNQYDPASSMLNFFIGKLADRVEQYFTALRVK